MPRTPVASLVLEYLVAHPNKRHYVEDLAHGLGVTVTQVTQALRNVDTSENVAMQEMSKRLRTGNSYGRATVEYRPLADTASDSEPVTLELSVLKVREDGSMVAENAIGNLFLVRSLA